ncbi:MAG: DUF2085 domain-containing protein [Lachnospiraceae bacterium]
MDKYTQKWIKIMDWCSKYWGCHQMPERSFFFKGFQFPICARCTGILLGYICAFIALLLRLKIDFYICILLIVPMAIDGTIQLLTKYNSNNLKRFITGFAAGIGFIWIIINIISRILSLF